MLNLQDLTFWLGKTQSKKSIVDMCVGDAVRSTEGTTVSVGEE